MPLPLGSLFSRTLAYILVGLLPMVAAAVVAMVWLGQLNAHFAEREQQDSLQRTVAAIEYGFARNYQQLEAEVQALADMPWLQVQMETEQGREQLAEQLKQSLPWVLAATAFAPGEAVDMLERQPPLTFSAVEMIIRAERGQTASPEAMVHSSQPYLQWALPVRNSNNRLLGSLQMAIDLQKVELLLLSFDPQLGRLQLIQQLANQQPMPLVTMGSSQTEGRRLNSPHPSWRLEYQPAPELLNTSNHEANFGPLLTMILVALLAFFISVQLLLRQYRQDLQALSGWLQRLVLGHRLALPEFKLPVVADLAKQVLMSLVRDNKEINNNEDISLDDASLGAKGDDIEDLLFGGLDIGRINEDKGVAAEQGNKAPVPLRDQIIRYSDVRGLVGIDLDHHLLKQLGLALGSELAEQGQFALVVARDSRPSSSEFADAFIQGAMLAGVRVIDLGMAPSPLLHFAMQQQSIANGVMVTASQAGEDYNGLKIWVGGRIQVGMELQTLWRRTLNSDFTQAKQPGKREQKSVQQDYIKAVCHSVQIERILKVVVDCSHGAASGLVRELLSKLGAKSIVINDDVKGKAGAYGYQPGHPIRVTALADQVKRTGADLGLAFDADADLLVVVSNQGRLVRNDLLLQLFAKQLLRQQPGRTVAFDVLASSRLVTGVESFAGRVLQTKAELSQLLLAGAEHKAILAGDTQGHLVFDGWLASPDALYAASRLIALLSSSEQDLDSMMSVWPQDSRSPEYRIEMKAAELQALLPRIVESLKTMDNVRSQNFADGIRLDVADAWLSVRASMAKPELCIVFEAVDDKQLARLQAQVSHQILRVAPKLVLPF